MTRAIECAHSVEGSGPPLILVHGIGAARDTWRFLMPDLVPHFTVISYDLRGHGASPIPDGDFGLPELVADMEHLRQQVGFAQVHLAGHSLGGMIAPAYARAYPGRVLSLGLLSTAAFRGEEDRRKLFAVIEAMEQKGVANVLETLVHRWYTDEFIAGKPDIVNRRLQQVIETDEAVFLRVFRLYAETEMSPWLHEINVPSLVLTGEHDGGCPPRLNRQIVEALPDAELVVLPELKHSLLLEAGETVARHLVNFITGLDRPK